jgi:hypothetical protein
MYTYRNVKCPFVGTHQKEGMGDGEGKGGWIMLTYLTCMYKDGTLSAICINLLNKPTK